MPGTVVITFKAPVEMKYELDFLAAKKGVPRSEIIRRAIAEYIKRNREERTIKIIRLTS